MVSCLHAFPKHRGKISTLAKLLPLALLGSLVRLSDVPGSIIIFYMHSNNTKLTLGRALTTNNRMLNSEAIYSSWLQIRFSSVNKKRTTISISSSIFESLINGITHLHFAPFERLLRSATTRE